MRLLAENAAQQESGAQQRRVGPGAGGGSVRLLAENVALRGTRVKQTDWAVGLVVYAGMDSKLQKNASQASLSSLLGVFRV